jgi:hypothetical protein
MRLTWKDGVTTLLAVAVVLVALAVVQEWGWPLLGSYRSGTVALAVLGLGMCALGGSTLQASAPRGPYFATTSMLGGLALIFAIWALVANTQEPFVALAIDTVLLWMVATLHHVVGSPRGRHAAMGTG